MSDPQMKTRIHSGSIKSHVCSSTVTDLSYSSHNIILRWIQDIMSAELLRKFFSSWRDLRDYDLLGPFRLQRLNDRQAYRSTSEDQDRITLLERTGVDGMPSYS